MAKELEFRYKNMHPDYEMRYNLIEGFGMFPHHRKTGEICQCKMEWNEDGSILSCPVCGLDGT